MNKDTNAIIVLVLLLLVILALAPLAVIWSLNTLFGLSIGFTFINWLATVVLLIAVKPAGVKVKAN